MTINITIKPTAKARLPFAICASIGRNGAPAAVPNTSSPTANASLICSSFVSAIAASGIKTKFATSDSATNLRLRSGAMICATVSPSPIDNMLDNTNTSIAIGTAFCSISIFSKFDSEAQPGQNGRVHVLRARLHDLDVGRQVTPRRERGVVVQFHALFVPVGKAGLGSQQILHRVGDADVKVSDAHRVVWPPGYKPAGA